MRNTKLKGNFLMLLTSFVWGLSFISQSKGVEAISPVAFNGIRCLHGSFVLIPVILAIDFGKKKKRMHRYYIRCLIRTYAISNNLERYRKVI